MPPPPPLHIPQDPETGVGKLMCTSEYSFWEVDLQLDNSTTPSKWEITNATILALLDSEYTGGYSFIPSGSNKNNIFFADYEGDKVEMMTFDDSGRPVVPTEITTFIEDIDDPWGFFFDPQVCEKSYCSISLSLLTTSSSQQQFTSSCVCVHSRRRTTFL